METAAQINWLMSMVGGVLLTGIGWVLRSLHNRITRVETAQTDDHTNIAVLLERTGTLGERLDSIEGKLDELIKRLSEQKR